MPKNPYKAYEKTRRETVSGREIEATVLEKAAVNLRKVQKNWKEGIFSRELDEALKFNQKIWDIFQSDWQNPNSALPLEIRQNLLSLSVFIRKTSLEIMADPEPSKLRAIIQINENLAKGLRSPSEEETGTGSAAEAPLSSLDRMG